MEMVAWIRGTYIVELQSLIILWTVAATAPPDANRITAFIRAIRISPGWTAVCASLLEVLVFWYWIEARRRARGQQYLMELADKDPDGIVAAFLDDGRIHAVQETHDSLTITRCGLRRDIYRNEPPAGQSAGTPPICGPCLDKLYAEWKRNRRSKQ